MSYLKIYDAPFVSIFTINSVCFFRHISFFMLFIDECGGRDTLLGFGIRLRSFGRDSSSLGISVNSDGCRDSYLASPHFLKKKFVFCSKSYYFLLEQLFFYEK